MKNGPYYAPPPSPLEGKSPPLPLPLSRRALCGLALALLTLLAACDTGSSPGTGGSNSGNLTVTAVTVSPSIQNIVKGTTKQFTATVNVIGGAATTVTWAVAAGTGTKAAGTGISSTGLLTVASNETAATLTVTATSTFDTTKSGTATVTVYADSSTLPTVTGVSVSPATPSVVKGKARQFSAEVTVTNGASQSVTWSIVEANKAAGTTITSNGYLTVAPDEILATLTAKATSAVDDTKSGTAAVTVHSNSTTLPTVTGVSVSPPKAYVDQAKTRQFSATVAGTNSPAQTVTWTVAAVGGTKAEGTAISTTGLLTVDADETTATLTVTATSTVDTAQSGTAAVTIEAGLAPDAIAGYLGNTSEGASADDPVFVPVEDTDFTDTEWTSLLSTINNADKFVALDLSACASAAEFNPGTANTGESKVVSLVLPDTATSITAGTYDNPTFEKFTALTSVSGSAVEIIGNYAFRDCTALTAVSLPAAKNIGNGAFQSCAALTTVSIPAATDIGTNVFQDCTALTAVSIPAATSIGERALGNCTALTAVSLPAATDIGIFAFFGCTAMASVSFPAATDIGMGAFAECTALTEVDIPAATEIGDFAFFGCIALTTVSIPKATSIGEYAFFGTGTTGLVVTLGGTAPTLGSKMFLDVSSTKNVTVKVPVGAAAAYGTSPSDTTTPCWGNGFRGGGWTGSAFQSDGEVNSNITLTIETIQGGGQ